MANPALKWLDRALTEAGAPDQTRAALQAAGLGNPRAEQWRHANLRALEDIASFAPSSEIATALPGIEQLLPERTEGFARIVLIDGCPAPQLSDAGVLPRARAGSAEVAPLARLAALFDGRIRELAIDADRQLEIVQVASGRAASYARMRLRLAAGRQLQLIEWHVGGGELAMLACPSLHLQLAEGARLEHTRIQLTSAHTRWLDGLEATLAEGARWRLQQLMLGGAVARSDLAVQLAGARAEFDSDWLCLATNAQVHDVSATVRHQARDGRTAQRWRAIASSLGHASVSAEVQVAAEAAGADISQSLRGLIADRGSEINLRPRLTILTDQVQARHGAATGQLDEQALFYMLSRGLPPEQARGLLKWAFVAELLAALAPAELRARLTRLAAQSLGAGLPPELWT